MEYIAKSTLDCIADSEPFCTEQRIVYVIENQINKKVYVGITANTFVRRYGMRFESHNEHLMRSIEKHGLSNFVAYICYSNVEQYSELQQIEMDLIQKYNSIDKEFGYNKTLGGEGTLGYQFTEEDYLRIHIPVVALNRDGSFYKEYESQKQALDELGVYISDCLKMRTRLAHELIWLYKDEYEQMAQEDIDERVVWANNGLTQVKPVIALDRDGNFVQEFESVIVASRDLNCSCGTIVNSCKHTVKTFKNFIWFYKKDYEELSAEAIEEIIDYCNLNERGEYQKENLSIPIIALNIDNGDFVAKYSSAHEAELQIGVPNSNAHIVACCKGKLVSCYGYKWCYEDDYNNKTSVYLSKINASIRGRRAIVALDISTGAFIRKFASITEAMESLGKTGSGSISACCTGKLNYSYGYRWMYEEDYIANKHHISSIIAESNAKIKANQSKCRSIPVVIVYDEEVIIKDSIKNIAEYMLEHHGIKDVRSWFKTRGVPIKYKDKVSFCGTLNEYNHK